MSIFYIIIGVLVIAIGCVFFYKNKQKQPCLNTKQEPLIQLDTMDIITHSVIASEAKQLSNSNAETIQAGQVAHGLDSARHFINDVVVLDSAEEEQTVILDKEVGDPDNMDIVMLQIKALAGRPYVGYELLQALTSAGLTFGKMDIFHGNNFSVAAATKEGSFPVDSMGSFKCLGLMVFMKLDPKKKLMVTFDLMLDTARQLTEELGGEIYDDLNQPINAGTIKTIREKIYVIEANCN